MPKDTKTLYIKKGCASVLTQPQVNTYPSQKDRTLITYLAVSAKTPLSSPYLLHS